MADRTGEIATSIDRIRNAVYGKDVRESIARGIELCYDYVGGQAALDAAIQAREAVNTLQNVVDGSQDAINRLNQAVDDVGPEDQPVEPPVDPVEPPTKTRSGATRPSSAAGAAPSTTVLFHAPCCSRLPWSTTSLS